MTLNREELDKIKARCDYFAAHYSGPSELGSGRVDAIALLAHVADLQQRLDAVQGESEWRARIAAEISFLRDRWSSCSDDYLRAVEAIRLCVLDPPSSVRAAVGSASPEPPTVTYDSGANTVSNIEREVAAGTRDDPWEVDDGTSPEPPMIRVCDDSACTADKHPHTHDWPDLLSTAEVASPEPTGGER